MASTSKGLHWIGTGESSGAAVILRGRLRRQFELERVEQQARLGLWVGVAREHELAPVGDGHVHIDHLHGAELLEHTIGVGPGASVCRRRLSVMSKQ